MSEEKITIPVPLPEPITARTIERLVPTTPNRKTYAESKLLRAINTINAAPETKTPDRNRVQFNILRKAGIGVPPNAPLRKSRVKLKLRLRRSRRLRGLAPKDYTINRRLYPPDATATSTSSNNSLPWVAPSVNVNLFAAVEIPTPDVTPGQSDKEASSFKAQQ